MIGRKTSDFCKNKHVKTTNIDKIMLKAGPNHYYQKNKTKQKKGRKKSEQKNHFSLAAYTSLLYKVIDIWLRLWTRIPKLLSPCENYKYCQNNAKGGPQSLLPK